MQKDPGIEHDERYMAHVEPGETETIVWQFTRTGVFYFGCLISVQFDMEGIARIWVEPE